MDSITNKGEGEKRDVVILFRQGGSLSPTPRFFKGLAFFRIYPIPPGSDKLTGQISRKGVKRFLMLMRDPAIAEIVGYFQQAMGYLNAQWAAFTSALPGIWEQTLAWGKLGLLTVFLLFVVYLAFSMLIG